MADERLRELERLAAAGEAQAAARLERERARLGLVAELQGGSAWPCPARPWRSIPTLASS